MKDVEFVSELFAIVIDGIQDQQKTLNRFYADYDVVFPKKSKHLAKFRQVINSLKTISDTISDTRFNKKADFYALFAAVLEMNTGNDPLDLSGSVKSLEKLSKSLEADPENLRGLAQEYYTTIIEGGNKLAKRERRTEILLEQLS
jgi:hypothetical protein